APDLVLNDVPAVVKLLAETINQVRKGTLDPKVANCVGYLASILLRALEGSELAREIEQLRQEVEVLKHDRAGNAPPAGREVEAGYPAGEAAEPAPVGDPPERSLADHGAFGPGAEARELAEETSIVPLWVDSEPD